MKDIMILKKSVYKAKRCNFCNFKIMRDDGTPINDHILVKEQMTREGKKDILYCRKRGEAIGLSDKAPDDDYDGVSEGWNGELYEFKWKKAEEKLSRLSQELASAKATIEGLTTQVKLEKKVRAEREKKLNQEIDNVLKMNKSLSRENNFLQRENAELSSALQEALSR